MLWLCKITGVSKRDIELTSASSELVWSYQILRPYISAVRPAIYKLLTYCISESSELISRDIRDICIMIRLLSR